MTVRRKAWVVFCGVSALILILGSAAATLVTRVMHSQEDPEFGVTFSHMYAQQLGLDWSETFTALLDDLHVARVRIPIQWSVVESQRGVFDFSVFDQLMEESAEKDIDVTFVIGYKVPRWPECFIPDWAETFSKEDRREAALAFFRETVLRYRDQEALVRWQVENEPFFLYGECPWPEPARVRATVDLIHELDPDHPVMQTTSGEQSFWLAPAGRAEIIGASLYRVAYNDILGYVVFPIRPYMYQLQRLLAGIRAESVIISELQAEPWLSAPQSSYGSGEDLYRQFTTQDFEDHLDFAKRTGAEEIFLWGAEWWYYLKQQGDDRLWEFARTVFE